MDKIKQAMDNKRMVTNMLKEKSYYDNRHCGSGEDELEAYQRGLELFLINVVTDIGDFLERPDFYILGWKLIVAHDRIRESGGEPVMIVSTDGGICVCSRSECESLFDSSDFLDSEMVFDDWLLLRFEPTDCVGLGDTSYLIDDFIVLEMDENGNECGITIETIWHTLNYLPTHSTEIAVDGKKYPAVRMW